MDNASPHRSKSTIDCLTSLRLISAPHPPYSPDLAPSDFYLFGKVKHLLTGKKFASADEILHEICEILEIIGRDELNAVLPAGKRDYNNASIWTGTMWTKRILKMVSFFGISTI
jgi:transposase